MNIQKKIVRLMTYKSYSEHTEPIFKDLNILDIFKINDFLTAMFMFRYHSLKNRLKNLIISLLLIIISINITRETLSNFINGTKGRIMLNILLLIKELMFRIYWNQN